MLIAEVPIGYKDRPEGSESKLNTISDGFKVVFTILKLFKDYKPFTFFGLISLGLFVLGLVLFFPILIVFIKTATVPRYPTLIAIIGIELSAMLSFFCGLILDTVRKYARQFYELNLNILKQKDGE